MKRIYTLATLKTLLFLMVSMYSPSEVQAQVKRKASIDSLRLDEYIVILTASGDTVFVSNATLARFHNDLSYPKHIWMPAVAWLPQATGMIDTLKLFTTQWREEVIVLQEGTTSSRTANIAVYLPPDFQAADSLKLLFYCSSTAGDSTQFSWSKRIVDIPAGVNITDNTNDGFVDSQIIGWRLSVTAGELEEIVLTTITDGTESSTFGPDKWAQFNLARTNPASEAELANVQFVGAILYYH